VIKIIPPQGEIRFQIEFGSFGLCFAYTMTETPKRDFHKAISRLSDTLRMLKLLPPFKTQNW
jgi:hypothetical protein